MRPLEHRARPRRDIVPAYLVRAGHHLAGFLEETSGARNQVSPAQSAGSANAAESIVKIGRKIGAGDGIRTVVPDLGKDHG
jgi:hypothetical protein